jgi:hypothetical protein
LVWKICGVVDMGQWYCWRGSVDPGSHLALLEPFNCCF